MAFEAFPTAVGEGQPGKVVGSRPGRGGGRGPAFPEQRRRLHQHVVHSCKHRTRWARHPRWQVNHQPGASPTPADIGSPAARSPRGPRLLGRESSRSFLRERPRPTRDLAPSWAAPRSGAEQRERAWRGRAACASRRGHLGTLWRRGARGVVPPPGQAGSLTPSRSGHASPPCKRRSGRKERSGGEPHGGAPIPGAPHRRGWRDKGAPSQALASTPGFEAVTVQKP